ncbi:hypothetical protein IW140_003520 [Coemansia sp. RSA 1813]|nr:hypothetical protein EV178_003391 [Coemansia sp. RSA 1646]KAJ2093512.1 hypothetical protein IW138_000364 [Coemansia sp. RSA 986]KAJ2568895.1 hypothetical protein IW140_003520 [Coemansia sp. RSA 1813]
MDIKNSNAEVLVISDDENDELVDPDNILGGIALNTPPRREGLRSRSSVSSISRSVGTKQDATSKKEPPPGPTYRNTLKSLVRASVQKKYDLGFLEAHIEKQSGMSDSDSDDSSDGKHENGSNEDVTLCFNDINEGMNGTHRSETKAEDIQRIKAQLNVDTGSRHTPIRFLVFDSPENPQFLRKDDALKDIVFDTRDAVDRHCEEHRSDTHFFRQLIVSRWIQAQGHRGWKLTQGVGDVLLRTVCCNEDLQAARCGLQTLCLFLELQHSSWKLDMTTLKMLIARVQGRKRDHVVSFESDDELADLERRQSLPSVYVEIERKPPKAHIYQRQKRNLKRTNAERMPFLMQVASLALDSASVEDICWVVCTFVDCLLEHKNSLYIVHMQHSLASVIDRVAPASKWTLVWTACVTRIGQQLSHLRLPALLRVIESLPMSSKRCMQIRHSLAFLFLRLQTSDMVMADDNPMEKLAIAATLPSQIVLRVVGEMMDTSEDLFRIERSTNFCNVEAAVGLLGHVLDNVQALCDVKDEAREIYKRLSQMNRKINDGMASRIDKTLAKDAIQTLLVRVFMTAISDSKDRLDMLYNSSSDSTSTIMTTLDKYLKEPHVF